MSRPRGTLAQRISLLAVAVAVITALVAGALSFTLVRNSGARSARQTLAALADAAKFTGESALSAQAGQTRARRMLNALHVQFASIQPAGGVSGSRLATSTLRAGDIPKVLGGSSISDSRTVGGRVVLIEARPTPNGGIVLVQPRSDALASGDAAVRRTLLALLIAAGIAVVLGLAVAWRLGRPLRRTAQAARELASGRRDVVVAPQGPAEVAEVGAALNTLAAALAHSESRQRDFLLSVSHDLRTPLTAITGFAESLAEGVVAPDQAAQVGAVMLDESRRLGRLVTDLLDLARLDAQDFRIEFAAVNLTEVAQAAAAVWAARCGAAGVGFALESPPHPFVVTTDGDRVRQVLDGLLDNALRVTPANRPIVLALRAEAGAAVVEVRDGGPGLSEADLAVAFERSVLHERYRGVRQVGTGLGLAIVGRLVARLGGNAEAGHAPEGGARFTIRLPT
ncbi:MAG: HAMP domain-containing sensor histidine kinase [Pseudonocardiales bacterium]|nr:HAMP domain-containing histidine kinase [Actinomycetota bacterium]